MTTQTTSQNTPNTQTKLPPGWHTLCTVIIVSAALILFGYGMGSNSKATSAAETLTPVKIEYRDLTWPEYKARIELEVKQNLGPDFQESTIRFTPKKTPEFPLYRQLPVNSETGVMVIERVGIELVGGNAKSTDSKINTVDGNTEGISGTSGTGGAAQK